MWALDHLFLDHRGVPTLVEVKRASNRQIRREVVGQLLEYEDKQTLKAVLRELSWALEVMRRP